MVEQAKQRRSVKELALAIEKLAGGFGYPSRISAIEKLIASEFSDLDRELFGAHTMLRIAARPSATDQISEERMHALLVEAVENCGSQKAWALASDVSPQYVNDCVRRHKPIGIGISKVFGYQPVTVYQPLVENENDSASLG